IIKPNPIIRGISQVVKIQAKPLILGTAKVEPLDAPRPQDGVFLSFNKSEPFFLSFFFLYFFYLVTFGTAA
ncbi:MAG: hypothetical protein AB8G05_00020, partial [Oligoflexales bacterium]